MQKFAIEIIMTTKVQLQINRFKVHHSHAGLNGVILSSAYAIEEWSQCFNGSCYSAHGSTSTHIYMPKTMLLS